MKKIWKRVCTGILALTTILTALPITSVQAAETQYWTESSERVGYIEHVMNDGTIHSTFNEGHMRVEGETAYCVDINTDFKSGYKNRVDAKDRMSSDQISDVALNLEYVKQYAEKHSLSSKQVYLLEQCVVWRRLSVHLGWGYNNVRAAYDEVSEKIQSAKAIKVTGKSGMDAYAGDLTVMANIIIEISDEGMPQLPEEDTSSPLILGNSMNISDPLVKITDLNAESGNVCIDGEILGMEDKETKTGKVILSINIYDGTSTMTCKAFLPGKNAKNIVKNTVMLLIMNMAKLVFPLFTLPYLTRILTTNLYGSVSYVKAVMEKMSSQNAGIA